MYELERYGIVPRSWSFIELDAGNGVVHLVADTLAFPVYLTPGQVEQLKKAFDIARKQAGREWRDGALYIPSLEHKDEK